jgi:hypothetical protein
MIFQINIKKLKLTQFTRAAHKKYIQQVEGMSENNLDH